MISVEPARKRCHRRTSSLVTVLLLLRAATVLCTMALLSGCIGPMWVHEKYYMMVPEGDECVCYRVTVSGATVLGEARFVEGRYPAKAVDALYGEVSKPTAPEGDTNEKRASRGPDEAGKDGAGTERPEQGRAQRESGQEAAEGQEEEKLVLVVSNDPDRIIEQIRRTSRAQQTQNLFDGFAEAAMAEQLGTLDTQMQRLEAVRRADVRIAGQIAVANNALGGEATRGRAQAEVDALLSILRSTNEGGMP